MLHNVKKAGYRASRWSCGGSVLVGGHTPALYLSAYGHTRSDGTFRFEQVYDLYSLHCIEEGAGVFELDGLPYDAEQGDLVLVRPGMHARYFDRPDSPWRYRWFALAGTDISAHLYEAGLREESPVVRCQWLESLIPVTRQIENIYARDLVGALEAVSMAGQVMASLGTILAKHSPDEARSLADRARHIIDMEYARGLQVEEIARRLRVSRATLFRQFKARFKESPKRYLDNVRLRMARELLLRGSSSVKEVARACGFESARYFGRVFARRYGMTASESRTAMKALRGN